jgi:hypothetical protein
MVNAPVPPPSLAAIVLTAGAAQPRASDVSSNAPPPLSGEYSMSSCHLSKEVVAGVAVGMGNLPWQCYGKRVAVGS